MVSMNTAVASNVGAGVSQVRAQGSAPPVELTDQNGGGQDVRGAALELIQNVLSANATTGHDLDVLA